MQGSMKLVDGKPNQVLSEVQAKRVNRSVLASAVGRERRSSTHGVRFFLDISALCAHIDLITNEKSLPAATMQATHRRRHGMLNQLVLGRAMMHVHHIDLASVAAGRCTRRRMLFRWLHRAMDTRKTVTPNAAPLLRSPLTAEGSIPGQP